ncbi:SCO2521 family protein [Micromonospora robiginosa]|uniref:SCO2521 family protein n=1 Tax=Micromonospora robiginosa TaxID=2749844 RepID=A0A7L6B535_9ACTN|nr:SCO2521 family protein [Micromonospora ferruginea]QLQ36700.1 SCO2521 family protein [Micromonospora ferruginea]
MITVGEVHTNLLQHSTALAQEQSSEVLSLVEGEAVLTSRRPSLYAVSPDVRTGVDCWLPSARRRHLRGVGAVVTRAVITGGRIVQASSVIQVVAGERRRPWSHYLANPGVLETVGKLDSADLTAGFLHGNDADVLNLEAITGRVLDGVQMSDLLDRRPPLRAARTRLRWAAQTGQQPDREVSAVVTVDSPTVRTVELVLAPQDVPAAVAGLCEDLALHDWLLTMLSSLVEAAVTRSASGQEHVERLRPVLEHLLHLWLPGARVNPRLRPIWDRLEQVPGFSRQWNSSVNWIRDQISVGNMALLRDLAGRGCLDQPCGR